MSADQKRNMLNRMAKVVITKRMYFLFRLANGLKEGVVRKINYKGGPIAGLVSTNCSSVPR